MVYPSAIHPNPYRRPSLFAQGFTLVEMGLVIAILGVLVLVGAMSIDWESGAAAVVDSTQGSVESIIRQGMAHTGQPAQHATVVTGVQSYVVDHILNGNGQVSSFACVTGSAICTITLTDGKVANYQINTDASVTINSVTGFTNYGVTDGRIAHN